MLKADQQRVRALLTETVALLCKNGLSFKSELCIEGLIGVTLDCEEIFLVNIKETIKLNSPAGSNESIHARAAVEPTPSSKKARQPASCAEISSQTATDCTPSSTKPKQPLATSNVDDTSISGCSFGSPAVPSSAKIHPEDAALVPLSKSVAGVVTERLVSFHDVPIKLDSALGPKTLPEDAFEPSEAHPSEPAQKRLRTQPQRRSAEKKGASKPPTPKMPSKLSSSKQESANVIEIKEESLSDEELTKHSATDYPSYDDYGAMTTYGVSDFDAGRMFGESSFRTEATFHEEMQAQTLGDGIPAGFSPSDATARNMLQCRECGKTFSQPSTLKRHIRKVHLREYPFACKICGKGVSDLVGLEGHMATKHGMPKTHRCPHCAKEYAYKCKLSVHLQLKHGQLK